MCVCQRDTGIIHALSQMGFPDKVQLDANMHYELTRLHILFKEGKFDVWTTPTILQWMLNACLRKADRELTKVHEKKDIRPLDENDSSPMLTKDMENQKDVCKDNTPQEMGTNDTQEDLCVDNKPQEKYAKDAHTIRCDVCFSQHHSANKCVVACGITPEQQMMVHPDLSKEIIRLHKLHLTGVYDPYATPTTLRCILKIKAAMLLTEAKKEAEANTKKKANEGSNTEDITTIQTKEQIKGEESPNIKLVW